MKMLATAFRCPQILEDAPPDICRYRETPVNVFKHTQISAGIRRCDWGSDLQPG